MICELVDGLLYQPVDQHPAPTPPSSRSRPDAISLDDGRETESCFTSEALIATSVDVDFAESFSIHRPEPLA